MCHYNVGLTNTLQRYRNVQLEDGRTRCYESHFEQAFCCTAAVVQEKNLKAIRMLVEVAVDQKHSVLYYYDDQERISATNAMAVPENVTVGMPSRTISSLHMDFSKDR